MGRQVSSLPLVQGAGSWDPTGAALKGKGDEGSCQVCMDHILQMGEWSVPMPRETSRQKPKPGLATQRACGAALLQKDHIQEVEAGPGYKEGLKKYCLGMQGWGYKTQSSA